MRRIVFWLLCLMVFTIPWEEAVTFVGIGALTRVVGYAVLLLAILSVLARGRVRSLHLFHVVALAFVTWNALSLIWTVNLEMSSDRVVTYISLIAFVWLIWEFADDRREQIVLMQIFILGSYVSMVDLVIRVAGGAPVGVPEYRFAGGGVNQNDLALALAIGVPIAFYLLNELGARSVVLRVINALYWPLSGFAIVMTGSRGGLISFGLASAIVLFGGYRGSMWTKMAISLLGIAALVVAFSMLPEATRGRLIGIQQEVGGGNWGERTLILDAGIREFKKHPIIGVGSGAFAYGIDVSFRGYVAHNAYLSVLVESGVIGFSLFVSLLVIVAVAIRKIPKAERTCWLAILLTWAVGVVALSWDYRKPTWLVLALAISWAAYSQRKGIQASDRSVGMPDDERLRGIAKPQHSPRAV